MEADFTKQHISKITDPVILPKNKLERGMVAKVKYQKVNGDTGVYYTFVLQPDYKHYYHCIDLKHIHPTIFKKLAEEHDEIIATSAKIKKLDLTKLQLLESSKSIYLREIRNKKLDVGYRTFLLKNIKQVTVYNYNYGVYDKIAKSAIREADARESDNNNTI